MSNNPKELRKQLKNVVKELLPEIINAEQYALLKSHNDAKLADLEKFVKDTMHAMNQRHMETMGYLVRQSTLTTSKK